MIEAIIYYMTVEILQNFDTISDLKSHKFCETAADKEGFIKLEDLSKHNKGSTAK